MTAVESLLVNLTSPAVLAFFLGMLAALLRSDLRVPPQVHEVISQYLLFAIGLKGGFALAETALHLLVKPAIATLVIGTVTTFIAFAAARFVGRQNMVNACALAAHYGSVSAVTFMAALSFIRIQGGNAEAYMAALLALLEIPAIVIALMLASRQTAPGVPLRHVFAEVFTGKTLMLLVGGIVIGVISGHEGRLLVEPVFITAFQGVLVLFLLEMGIVAAERIRAIRRRDAAFILLFGTILPVLFAFIGVAAGQMADLSPDGVVIMATMAASSSYIAAPAAVRLSIPEANAGMYLTASIGVTLPFNLIVGIPFYHQFVHTML